MFKKIGNNETIPMTRRYPDLRQKQLQRDSRVMQKLVKAWDVEGNPEQVLQIFLNEMKNLSNERYWEMLRTVWIICGSENVRKMKSLFFSKRKMKHYFSTPEETKEFRELPEYFWVYRATNHLENDAGISWTLSKEYAERFQKDFNKKHIVSRSINKAIVFALINRNNESEIIIL